MGNTRAYVCQSEDHVLLRESASGGAFSHLANMVLEQGGAVFGALWREGRCFHACVRTKENLAALRGSKYMLSDLGGTFQETKELLEQGTRVLYSGTPCQITALHAFLGKDYPLLYTADLVCHGLPEPKVWEAYAARFPTLPATVSFRDKRAGWRRYALHFCFPDGTAYHSFHGDDMYMRAYLSNLSLRSACLRCRCNTDAKRADITLGDDWGGELLEDGDRGSSLVLTHTDKGESLFRQSIDGMRTQEISFASAAAANPVLLRPSPPHPKRELFLEQVNKENFDKLVRAWDKRPLLPRAKAFLRRFLR